MDRRPNSEGKGEPALIETEPLEVNVRSEFGGQSTESGESRADGAAAAGFADYRDPVDWSRRASPACSAILGLVALRRRKRRADRTAPPDSGGDRPRGPGHLLAENLPARGLIKEFYLRLTGIVRQYVEDTTGIRAPEQTTEEFLRDMRSRAAFPPERSAGSRNSSRRPT